MEPFSYKLSCLPAGTEVKVPVDTLKLNREFINRLSEAEKAKVKIEVLHKNAPVITEEVDISIHPIEHFGGFKILPELIATYITPNHPYVYHIKRRAIEILEQQGLKTAFEGYQSNSPERVLQMMSAVFSAI